NMGAWSFAADFIEEVARGVGLKHARPRYAGRLSAASPATGLASRHLAEQASLVDDALAIGKPALSRIAMRKDRQARSGRHG
ncbi:MAG: hypothetical protein ACE5DS_07690, partial [Kiloniellaceae bacterium]